MAQAVILAGGKGTRLAERLNGLPKPLIDVCGIPLLERQILLCKKHGIDSILILVSHAADRIVEFCARKDNWDLRIECLDDGEPKGTAGAVLAALDKLEDEFLVVYGDTMIAVDIGRFWRFHKEHAADATLFLHPNDHPYDSDLVSMDDEGKVLAFHPYPHPDGVFLPNLVNAALYVIRKSAIEPWRNLEGVQDFGKNLFPLMLQSGATLQGYNSPEYIKDVGTPDRLDKVCSQLESGKIDAASLDVPQAVVFLDRDGVINVDPGWLNSPDQFELMPGVGEAIRRLNASRYRSVVVTNQPVVARGEVSLDGLRQIHNKMDTLLGKQRAYVDLLYYCPHHPDRGFPGEVPQLKIPCDCRKPETGMLKRAQKDINADFGQSWIVGDSSNDILMGHRAGIRTILVETTPHNLPKGLAAEPDFVQPDLPGAVSFILDEFPMLFAWARQFLETVRDGEIIALGGLAHSGKSTLASVLKWALRQAGRPCSGFTLDRWIKTESERTEGVGNRFDMQQIRSVLEAVSSRQGELRLSAPRYDTFARQQIRDADEIRIGPNDVVVVDGVIALDATTGLTNRTIFVRCDESARLSRFLRKYTIRGMDRDDALELYESRKVDEEPIVNQGALVASTLIDLPKRTH